MQWEPWRSYSTCKVCIQFLCFFIKMYLLLLYVLLLSVEGVCCWWLVYSLTWPESDWLDSGWVGLHTWGAWAIMAPQDKPAINTHTRGGATVMTIYHQLGEYHQPVNSNKHLCTTSTRVLCRRSPRKATLVACGGATLPHCQILQLPKENPDH